MTKKVEDFYLLNIKDPVLVEVAKKSLTKTLENLEQSYVVVIKPEMKFQLLFTFPPEEKEVEDHGLHIQLPSSQIL